MRVRLAPAAEGDIKRILRQSVAKFGPAQAERYRSLIRMAIDRLAEAPGGLGTRPRDDVAAGLRSLHLAVVARRRRSARHVLLFRLLDDEVVIVRVLHERMQLKADRVQDR